MIINQIVVSGIAHKINYCHKIKGDRFYVFALDAPRRSGTIDQLTIVLPEDLGEIVEGDHVTVSGSVKSCRADQKLINYVLADHVSKASADYNEAVLEGFICSEPYRKSTATKQLTQFLISTGSRRPTYLSVLLWTQNDFKIGDRIYLQGRLQSRTYFSAGEEKTATEFSAYRVKRLPTFLPAKFEK